MNDDGLIVNYERLEFLGDSVLNAIVSSLLFRLFPNENEGSLAKRKHYLVCRSTIVSVARLLKLDDFVLVNSGCNGGRCSEKNLEYVLEALIGAIFVDGGYENVERFVVRYWEELAKSSICPPEDPKTALQEWTQKNKLPLPRYDIIEKEGPLHRPRFKVSVCIDRWDYGTVNASAANKKMAEQRAAKIMLGKINDDI